MKILQNRTESEISGISPSHYVEVTSVEALELESLGMSPLAGGDLVTDRVFRLSSYKEESKIWEDAKAAARELAETQAKEAELARLAEIAARELAIAEAEAIELASKQAKERIEILSVSEPIQAPLVSMHSVTEFVATSPQPEISLDISNLATAPKEVK